MAPRSWPATTAVIGVGGAVGEMAENVAMALTLTFALPGLDSDQRERSSFTLMALDHSREPLAGAVVTVVLASTSGSLRGGGQRGAAIELTTDDHGLAEFSWSPGPTASPPDEAAVRVSLVSADPRAVDFVLEPVVEVPWV